MKSGTAQDLTLLAEKFFGIQLPVSEVTLKKSYRAASMRLHPDRGGDEDEFRDMHKAYELLTETPGVISDGNGSRPLTTREGILLSELGLGLGPTKNGKDCSDCEHLGYTKHHGRTFSVCEKCDYLGRVPLLLPCRDCKETGEFELRSGKKVVCRKCNGKKNFAHPFRLSFCPDCRGTKTIWNKTAEIYYSRCWKCHGAGEIEIFNPALPKGRLGGIR